MLTANKEQAASPNNLNHHSPAQCWFISTEDVSLPLIQNFTKTNKKSRDAHHIVQHFLPHTLACATPSASNLKHFEFM